LPSAEAAKQAETEAQRMLKLDANYVPGWLVLAAAQARLGDAKSAVQSYEKVLSHFPQFAPAQKALAALYADEPATEKKAYDLAVKARQVLPNDIDVAKTLGKLGYRRKDYRYAIQLLQESSRAQAPDAESFYYLGMAHYQLKEKAQSKEALQRALSLNLQAKLGDEARRVMIELK
jgi:Tfp pilus assembly protein PilF